MSNHNAEKLNMLLGALQAADEREAYFAMGHWINYVPGAPARSLDHKCGTPACALGHYRHAYMRRQTPRDWWGTNPLEYATREFGLSGGESVLLFGHAGCGGAKTAGQAAAYVAGFMRERGIEPLCSGKLHALVEGEATWEEVSR